MVPWRQHTVFMLSNLLSARGLSLGAKYIILCMLQSMTLQLSTVTLCVIWCMLCTFYFCCWIKEETFKEKICSATCTDRCFRVTNVIYIHKLPLTPSSCRLALKITLFIWCCKCIHSLFGLHLVYLRMYSFPFPKIKVWYCHSDCFSFTLVWTKLLLSACIMHNYEMYNSQLQCLLLLTRQSLVSNIINVN